MTQEKFEIEAAVGAHVVRVVSQGAEENSKFYGDEEFWELAQGQILLGGIFRIAGTSRSEEVGFTPFGMMAAMSSVNGGLIFTKVPRIVQEYFTATRPSGDNEVYF